MKLEKLQKYCCCLVVFYILFVSCAKKKKRESIEGVYKGTERFIHIGPYGDTSADDSYADEIQILLKNRKLFTLTKDTYPFSYDIPTIVLVNEDSVTKWQILPQVIWEVHIVGDSLYGVFQENDNWAGSQDHYRFKGVK